MIIFLDQVRREKINEKMRFLQDLVPGCQKVKLFPDICYIGLNAVNIYIIQHEFYDWIQQTMGMAVMLDEIINYVHSLQNQVEVN